MSYISRNGQILAQTGFNKWAFVNPTATTPSNYATVSFSQISQTTNANTLMTTLCPGYSYILSVAQGYLIYDQISNTFSASTTIGFLSFFTLQALLEETLPKNIEFDTSFQGILSDTQYQSTILLQASPNWASVGYTQALSKNLSNCTVCNQCTNCANGVCLPDTPTENYVMISVIILILLVILVVVSLSLLIFDRK